MTEDPRLGKPSASAYAILEQCPGQPEFVKTIPEEPKAEVEREGDEWEWARRGTRIHKALETRDTSGLKDESEIDDYNLSLKYEQDMFERWRMEFKIPIEKIRGPFQEVRLWLNHPSTAEPMISAQLDTYWLAEPYALILDRKTGYNPKVPAAEQSGQLRVQAVVAWKEHDISQIRIGHVKQKFRSTASDYSDYLSADLEYAEKSILYHLWEAEQPDAPLRAGSHCNWCRAKAFCKQAAAFSMLPSVIAGEALPAKPKERDAQIALMVAQLQPADLRKLWSKKLIIEKVLAAAVARLKAMDNDSLKEIGLTFGKPRTNRNVINAKEAFEALKTLGCTEEQLWAVMELPLGKTADMLNAYHDYTKEHATQKLREFLKQWIEEKDCEPPIELI